MNFIADSGMETTMFIFCLLQRYMLVQKDRQLLRRFCGIDFMDTSRR